MHLLGLLHTFYFFDVYNITAYLMPGFLLVAPSSIGQALLLFLFVVHNEGTLSCFIASDLGFNVWTGVSASVLVWFKNKSKQDNE